MRTSNTCECGAYEGMVRVWGLGIIWFRGKALGLGNQVLRIGGLGCRIEGLGLRLS